MYLLDTNIICELTRRKPNPHILAWLESVAGEPITISFSAVFEIQRGIENLRGRDPEKAGELQHWLERLLASDIPFLPMDADTARFYGMMTSAPALRDLWVPDSKAKRPKPGQDLAIAATAIAYDIPIATRNLKDFVRIDRQFPLPGLFDPVTREWKIARRPSSIVPRGFSRRDIGRIRCQAICYS